MSESNTHPTSTPVPDQHAQPSGDYRERAASQGLSLDFNKRHLFRSGSKAMIFEDFEHARDTVKGKMEALVIVDNAVKGAIALDRETIQKVFPELLEAFDHLTTMKREKDQAFDPERDLVVLFADGPLPRYHGKDVKGFWVWRVAGTCHFRQYPTPDDSKAERRAFGSQGD